MAHHHHGPGGHDHQHAPGEEMHYGQAFGWGIALNLVFVVAEAGGGFFYNSAALLSDAGHNLSDVLSLALAWGATLLASRPSSARYTYGLKGITIQAALLNAALLYVALGIIFWETIEHLRHPAPVNGYAVMVLAGIGIGVNGFTAWLFRHGQKGDVNVRGAYLHMLTDALVSLGVVLGGGLVLLTGWQWLDPLISFAILALIAYGSWDLLRETMQLVLQAVPAGIDPAAVRRFLLAQPGVTQVHDLHIWPLSTRDTALTVHLVRPAGQSDNDFLRRLQQALQHEFGIGHCTVQVEHGVPLAEAGCGCVSQEAESLLRQP